MTDLSATAVRKTYRGGFEAVKGVSFTVADGTLCVLVGPSGCGKSTLLRMIAGLETITSGEIRIGARRVNELEPIDRDVAMVFQNYALYPHMSVYDNMAYGLRNLRTPATEIEARVREAARILELDAAMLQRQPRQLSGGQRQRVAMGRAIVRKPALFLFDEPLSNLDAKLRVQMRVEIRKLQRRLATTSVYVTHDQSEAMTLADMLVVMNLGLVEQAAAPLDIYARPASRFVAGFIGSPPMNFLDGTVVAAGLVRLAGGMDLAYDAAQFGPAVGQAVVAGIRPEHVALGGPVKLTVEVVEELGSERLIHGRLGDVPFTVAQRADVAPPSGPILPLDLPAGRVHLFDAATGLRVP